jgi:pantoate--beta-alanine ligase
MKILLSKNKLIKIIKNEKNLGFVPTMGCIHKGHVSLIKKCNSQCNKTVVTIFVNKPQFNRKSDYQNYPRTLGRDIKILKKLKIDYLYLPYKKQIYPNGPNKKIKISAFSKKLCGEHRPKHFEAVVDVVERFIKILNPKKIYFGQKDMQQLKIIKHFTKKKYTKIKIVGCKTIREKNGIAYSSRNLLLSDNEKKIAGNVYNLILNKKKYLIRKKLSINLIKSKIIKLGVSKIEYLKILDINKLVDKNIRNKKNKIFIAYYLRATRLIDNI